MSSDGNAAGSGLMVPGPIEAETTEGLKELTDVEIAHSESESPIAQTWSCFDVHGAQADSHMMGLDSLCQMQTNCFIKLMKFDNCPPEVGCARNQNNKRQQATLTRLQI
jgi:hypothetical protein